MTQKSVDRKNNDAPSSDSQPKETTADMESEVAGDECIVRRFMNREDTFERSISLHSSFLETAKEEAPQHPDDEYEGSSIVEEIQDLEDISGKIRRDVTMVGRCQRSNSGAANQRHFSDEEVEALLSVVRSNQEESDLECHRLPQDTFSLLAFVEIWTWSFWCAIGVFALQVATLSLLAADIIDLEDSNNPLGIPPNVESPVRASQILALFITVKSQMDIVASLNVLYNGYDGDALLAVMKDRDGVNPTHSKWLFSLVCRYLEGCLSLALTFMLIMRADTVRDILLDFTAVEFVSNIDNVTMTLARWGYLMRAVKKHADNPIISDEHVPAGRPCCFGMLFARTLFLNAIFAIIFGFWGWIAMKQMNGSYLRGTLLVQFGDDFDHTIGTFSGLYELEDFHSMSVRPRYAKYVDKHSGNAYLGHCDKENTWTFFTNEDDPCDWQARSPESHSFDILETASLGWLVKNEEGRSVPMQHFVMLCYGCQDQSFDHPCRGRGSFVDNQCKCDGEWFGLSCEFSKPCESLEIDTRRGGFLSTREWATHYDVLRTNRNEVVEVYNRPVYFAKSVHGIYEIILFTGRRWVLFHREETQADLEQFLNEFHGHFSSYRISFITEPMDVNTPTDAITPVGLKWFHATEQDDSKNGTQSVDSNRESEAVLQCAVCNHVDNVCQNDGLCVNGRCECATGATGTLCQIPPVQNGHCDSFFNSPEFNYDGGDCCGSTCVSTPEYTCGKDETGFTDVGYFFCNEPVNKWKPAGIPISGSGNLARSGSSAALSTNGMTLAIGEPGIDTVQILYKDGSQWIQRASLEGPPGSEFGLSIAMSGSLPKVMNSPATMQPVSIAIGAPSFRSDSEGSVLAMGMGMVRVYECTTLRCSQVGTDLIFGEIYPDAPERWQFGRSLAISRNGLFIAVATFPSTSIIEHEKKVLVYEREDSHLVRRGGPVLPVGKNSTNAGFGESLALSENGDALAVKSAISGQGHAVVIQLYTWDGTNYVPVGNEIENDYGSSQPVAMSDDAMVLAMGAEWLEGEGKEWNGVTVYQWNERSSNWTQRGSPIPAGSLNSLDMSSDGSVVALGAEDGGPVRVFNWNGTEYEQLWNDIPVEEKSSLVALSGNGKVLAVGQPSSEFKRGGTVVYDFASRCRGGRLLFRLSLMLDDHARYTRWDLINSSGDVLLKGGPYSGHDSMTVVDETCLEADKCFKFTIYDIQRDLPDGIEPPGGYGIFLDGEEHHKGGNFSDVERVDIGSCGCTRGTSRFRIVMTLNSDPYLTSWDLVDDSNQILSRGANYSIDQGRIVEETCVSADACVSFTIRQAYLYYCEESIPSYTLYRDDVAIASSGGEQSSYGTYKEFVYGREVDVWYETVRSGKTCPLPTNAPTKGPTRELSCRNDKALFHLSLALDDSPYETRWDLIDRSDDIILEGGPYCAGSFRTFVEETCVNINRCFMFTIYDRSLNGITPPGGYSIFLDGKEQYKGGNFSFFERVYIGNCACPNGTSTFRIAVTSLNSYPAASWDLVDDSNRTLLQGANYSDGRVTVVDETCVPAEACVSFTIRHAVMPNFVRLPEYSLFRDGELIASGGDNAIFYTGEDEVLVSGREGDVWYDTVHSGKTCPLPTKAPTEAPSNGNSTE